MKRGPQIPQMARTGLEGVTRNTRVTRITRSTREPHTSGGYAEHAGRASRAPRRPSRAHASRQHARAAAPRRQPRGFVPPPVARRAEVRAARRGLPPADRGAPAGAECLHHRDRRPGAGRGAHGRPRDGRRPPPRRPARHADVAEGPHRPGRRAHHGRLAGPRGALRRHDAPVTARLRAAGAVFVGKTNLHEFAFGTTSDDSGFGPARHPLDASRGRPAASSGGSAISVATGMALASIGTDTGGSIRIPAAACGIVGLKPQLGRDPDRGRRAAQPPARSRRAAWRARCRTRGCCTT